MLANLELLHLFRKCLDPVRYLVEARSNICTCSTEALGLLEALVVRECPGPLSLLRTRWKEVNVPFSCSSVVVLSKTFGTTSGLQNTICYQERLVGGLRTL